MRRSEMLALWARLLPLLLALLLALPAGARGAVSFVFCHGMGRVVDKCCCPSRATAAPTMGSSCGAKIQPRDCCERIERASANGLAASREKASVAGSLQAALTDAFPILVRGSTPPERFAVPEPVEAHAPRPRGPPL